MGSFFAGNTLLSVILTVLVFGLLITGHEWGHFFVAKKNGVLVEEFSIGMGPAIFSRQKGETLYSLRLIPFGGYCKMHNEFENTHSDRGFMSKTVWQRIQILLAGPVMNFIIALILIFAVTGAEGFVSTEISALTPDFGAEEAGILPGDRIISINDKKIFLYEDIAEAITDPKKEVLVGVERDGKSYYFDVMPKYSEDLGRYLIGFTAEYKTGIFGEERECYEKAGFIDTIKYSLFEMGYFIKMTFSGITGLFTQKYTVDDMSGPIGVIQIVGDSYEAGMTIGIKAAIENVMYIAALLSANLGVLNLFPIPALDGGRILLAIIEGIRGKALDQEKESVIQFVCFIFLFGLAIFIAFNDITKLV